MRNELLKVKLQNLDLKKYIKNGLNIYKYIYIYINMKDYLPEEIIRQIKDYTPKDKDMKSPTSSHIKKIIYYYNYDYERMCRLIDAWEEEHGPGGANPLFDEYYTELFYAPYNYEQFYKYIIRISMEEKKIYSIIH